MMSTWWQSYYHVAEGKDGSFDRPVCSEEARKAQLTGEDQGDQIQALQNRVPHKVAAI